MVCSNRECVAEASAGGKFCTVHGANMRRVEPVDLAAGRVCSRCMRKLVKGEWIKAFDGSLVHLKACKDKGAAAS